jgi:hypothetical protein
MRVTLSLDEIEGYPEIVLTTDDRKLAANTLSEVDGKIRELLEVITRIFDKKVPF